MMKKMRMEAELSSAREGRATRLKWRIYILVNLVWLFYLRLIAVCLPHTVLVGESPWRNDDLDESRDSPSKK
jgi:hypothetical protein